MSYIFYLDGTIYDNPAKDRTLSTRIKRNSNLNGILTTQDAKLDFQGAAYIYLYDIFFAGLCSEVEVQIWEDCEAGILVYDGVIKIADIKINYQTRTISSSIEDRDFFSYINNNKSVKVSIGIDTLSKTGEIITNLDPYKIRFFAPCIGTHYTAVIQGWRVFDIMQFILDYITDNRIELQSDLLSGQGDANELFLTKGRNLTAPYALPDEVKLSFNDIYEFVQRIYNLAFKIIIPATGRTILKIEKQDDLYLTSGNLVFADVKDLEISADNSEIYSSVSMGGPDTEGVTQNYGVCPAGIHTGLDGALYGWAEQQFHLFGQCNQDNELDLKVKFQIASNVIEDIYTGGSPDFDDDILILEIENVNVGLLTCDLVIWDYYGAGVAPYYYNLGINNENVIFNRSGYLHQSAQQYFAGVPQFKVTQGSVTYRSTDASICVSIFLPTTTCPATANTIQPVNYNDDISLGNYNLGDYNTGTFQYTCPAGGDYTFNHTTFFTTFGIQPAIPGQQIPSKIELIVGFENITTGIIRTQSRTFFDNATGTLTSSSSIPCALNDVIEARYQIKFSSGTPGVPPFGIVFSAASFFSGTATNAEVEMNTEEFKALLFKFEYPLTGTELRTLVADPTQLITITSNGETFKGWIDEVKNNDWENKAQITLRSNAIIQDT